MVRRNQLVQSQEDMIECCDHDRYRAPAPVIPPIAPVVSVKSVNGETGDIILKNLIIGDLKYNGSSEVKVELEDFGVEGIVCYKGMRHSVAEMEATKAEEGDVYYCEESNEFWFAIGRGTGTFKRYPCSENLIKYALGTESGRYIALELDKTTYKIRATLYNRDANPIHSSEWIDLPIESLVKYGYYDALKKEIVLVLLDDTEIRIPVGDLISGLLEKITPENPLPFNLVKDLPEFKAQIESDLSDEATIRANNDNSLLNKINVEGETRLAKDTELNAKIDKEIADRKQDVINSVAAEAEKRILADSNLNDRVDNEIDDRHEADDVLLAKINKEVQDRIDAVANEKAERITADSDEKTARMNADSALQTALTKEITDREAAIAKEVVDRNTAIQAEKERALAAEAVLNTAIQNEAADRVNAINAEATARTNADQALDQKFSDQGTEIRGLITAEKTRALAAEAELQTSITRVEDTFENALYNESVLRQNADTALNTKIEAETSDREAAVLTEENARKAADEVLSKAIADEATARTTAVAGVQSNLDTEIAERKAADKTLSEAIHAEATTRLTADQQLETKMGSVDSKHTTAETKLAADLAEEARIRDSKCTWLGTEIQKETVARQAVDEQINIKITETNKAIAQEATDRAHADGLLDGRIIQEAKDRAGADDALASDLNTKVQNEAALRKARDDEQQIQIDKQQYKIVKDASSEVYAAVYRLFDNDGNQCGTEINIPKDSFLENVTVFECTKDDEPEIGMIAGKKYLHFVFLLKDGTRKHLYILIDEMVRPYTAGRYITIKNGKTEDNSINVSDEFITIVENIRADLVKEVTIDRPNAIKAEEDARKAADLAEATARVELAEDTTRKFNAVNEQLANRTVQKIVTTNGSKALMFNETSGGGAKFENADGTWSYAGVNDGGATGIAAQIYAVDSTNYKGTKLDVTKSGIYYTTGDNSGLPALQRDVPDNELIVKSQLDKKIDKTVFTYVIREIDQEDEA